MGWVMDGAAGGVLGLGRGMYQVTVRTWPGRNCHGRTGVQPHSMHLFTQVTMCSQHNNDADQQQCGQFTQQSGLL